jgi:hypothetical protein
MADIEASLGDANANAVDRAGIDEDELSKEFEQLLSESNQTPSKWGAKAKVPVGFLTGSARAVSSPSPATHTHSTVKMNSSRVLVGAGGEGRRVESVRKADSATATPRKDPSTLYH